MNMEETINEFERLVILKTVVCDVDLNFLDIGDLEKIDEYAYDMEIELPEADLEGLYNFQFDEIKNIYNSWKDYIFKRYEEIKEELLK